MVTGLGKVTTGVTAKAGNTLQFQKVSQQTAQAVNNPSAALAAATQGMVVNGQLKSTQPNTMGVSGKAGVMLQPQKLSQQTVDAINNPRSVLSGLFNADGSIKVQDGRPSAVESLMANAPTKVSSASLTALKNQLNLNIATPVLQTAKLSTEAAKAMSDSQSVVSKLLNPDGSLKTVGTVPAQTQKLSESAAKAASSQLSGTSTGALKAGASNLGGLQGVSQKAGETLQASSFVAPELTTKLRIMAAEEKSWGDQAKEGFEYYGSKVGQALSGAKGQEVAKEAAANIEASGGATNPSEQATLDSVKGSSSKSSSSSKGSSSSSGSSKSSSGSGYIGNSTVAGKEYPTYGETARPTSPKDGDVIAIEREDGGMKLQQWDKKQGAWVAYEAEEEPVSSTPTSQKTSDSSIITRGSNTYKRIREVTKDEIEPRSLYLIERDSGSKAVISGESALGVNTKGAHITKVEMLEGTPIYLSNPTDIARPEELRPVITETFAKPDNSVKYGSNKGSYIYNFMSPVGGQTISLSSDRPLSDTEVEDRANAALGIKWDTGSKQYVKTTETPSQSINDVKTLGKNVSVLEINGQSKVNGTSKPDILSQLPYIGKSLVELKTDFGYSAEKSGLLQYMGNKTIDADTSQLISSAGNPLAAIGTISGVLGGKSWDQAWGTQDAPVYVQTAQGQALVKDMTDFMASGKGYGDYDASKKSDFKDVQLTADGQMRYFLTYATDAQIDEVYNKNPGTFADSLKNDNLNTLVRSRLGQERVDETSKKYNLGDVNYSPEYLASKGVNLGKMFLLDANIAPRNDVANTLLLGVNLLTLPFVGPTEILGKAAAKDVAKEAVESGVKNTIVERVVTKVGDNWVTDIVGKDRKILDADSLPLMKDGEIVKVGSTAAETVAKESGAKVSTKSLQEALQGIGADAPKLKMSEDLFGTQKVAEQAGKIEDNLAASAETPSAYEQTYIPQQQVSQSPSGGYYESPGGQSYYPETYNPVTETPTTTTPIDTTPTPTTVAPVETFDNDLGTLVRQYQDGTVKVYDNKSNAWLSPDDYASTVSTRKAAEDAAAAAATEPTVVEKPVYETVEKPVYVDSSSSGSSTVAEVAEEVTTTPAAVSLPTVEEKIALDMADDDLLKLKAEATDPSGVAEHAQNILAVAFRKVQNGGTLDEVKDLIAEAEKVNAKVKESVKLCKI